VASYSIQFRPSVEKDFTSLPKSLVSRVHARIQHLAGDPFPHSTVKLQGAERMYRLRVGDYRIVYDVDTDAALITIHAVRHRRDVYRRLR
jgi:mRNA interferase RelE/StbE